MLHPCHLLCVAQYNRCTSLKRHTATLHFEGRQYFNFSFGCRDQRILDKFGKSFLLAMNTRIMGYLCLCIIFFNFLLSELFCFGCLTTAKGHTQPHTSSSILEKYQQHIFIVYHGLNIQQGSYIIQGEKFLVGFFLIFFFNLCSFHFFLLSAKLFFVFTKRTHCREGVQIPRV